MAFIVKEEKLDNLDSYALQTELVWPVPFILPPWLKAWWSVFGEGSELFIRALYDGDKVIGVAPLRIKDNTALFIGDTDICDYADFITAPGREEEIFNTLLDDLSKKASARWN